MAGAGAAPTRCRGRPSIPSSSDAFLRDEAARAVRGETTDDCRDGACTSCGVCGGEIEMELVR